MGLHGGGWVVVVGGGGGGGGGGLKMLNKKRKCRGMLNVKSIMVNILNFLSTLFHTFLA